MYEYRGEVRVGGGGGGVCSSMFAFWEGGEGGGVLNAWYVFAVSLLMPRPVEGFIVVTVLVVIFVFSFRPLIVMKPRRDREGGGCRRVWLKVNICIYILFPVLHVLMCAKLFFFVCVCV